MRENREKWMELCEQAATEQDPEKLMELISQINRLLEAKERRLKGNPSATEPAGSLSCTRDFIEHWIKPLGSS